MYLEKLGNSTSVISSEGPALPALARQPALAQQKPENAPQRKNRSGPGKLDHAQGRKIRSGPGARQEPGNVPASQSRPALARQKLENATERKNPVWARVWAREKS
ncbi:MAG: hypothetical protein JRJ79_01940 [Deltaproteobacteria bacterium]|nr:hypothetical protein [Deltaproteobacteria bacterium]MBW1793839.1 hypothetical protein [Deltaproteobacteria bacterium]